MLHLLRRSFFVLLPGLLLAACSGPGYSGSSTDGDPARQIAYLQGRLVQNPNDTDALRDLGMVYLNTGQPDAALPPLRQAHERAPGDPSVRFAYGLGLEATGDRTAALQLYSTYAQAPRTSPYRRRLAGRYEWLLRETLREEIRNRIADEDALNAPPPGTVAVFPLTYQGDTEQYAPIGRGLSEMMAVDLSQVQALTVVERARMQTLLDELALAQSEVVDPASAPRTGRLLGARRLVGGQYNVLEGGQLRTDLIVWEIDDDPEPVFTDRSGDLDAFFELQKDLVFELLDQLGVELTPAERELIERVPTRNLQAFLAFSRGLQEEDAGRYGAAQQHFEQAVALDAGFEMAADHAETTAGIAEAGGSLDRITAAMMPDLAPPTPQAASLIETRQQNLGRNVGSLYVPGEDDREPAAEASNAGGTPAGGLPLPPAPPARDN